MLVSKRFLTILSTTFICIFTKLFKKLILQPTRTNHTMHIHKSQFSDLSNYKFSKIFTIPKYKVSKRNPNKQRREEKKKGTVALLTRKTASPVIPISEL